MTDKLRTIPQNQIQSLRAAHAPSNETVSTHASSQTHQNDLPVLTRRLAGAKAHDGVGSDRLLNLYELKAITQFIVYVAQVQSISENTVCAILSARFDVTEVQAIPARFYNEIMDTLLDFDATRILN